MREAPEVLVPHEKQVHHVAVVRNERRPATLLTGPRTVVDRQTQDQLGAQRPRRRRSVQRPVQTAPVRGVHRVPPRPSADGRQGEHPRRCDRCDARPHGTSSVGLLPGREHAVPHGGADDRHRPNGQEGAESEQGDGDGPLQVDAAGRDGQDGDEHGAAAARSLHRHADAVGSAAHQPQRGGVQRRISRDRLGDVGGRRRGGPWIPEHGEHEHPHDGLRGEQPHRDLREAGNDARIADDHPDGIGPGGALEVGVGAAHMCGGDGDRGGEPEGPQRTALHRCTRAIQFPHHRPSRVETTARPAAIASPRSVTGSPGSRQNW